MNGYSSVRLKESMENVKYYEDQVYMYRGRIMHQERRLPSRGSYAIMCTWMNDECSVEPLLTRVIRPLVMISTTLVAWATGKS